MTVRWRRSLRGLAAACALVALIAASPASATPTTRDPGFGAGFRRVSFRNTFDGTVGVAVRRPNGQILLGETTNRPSPSTSSDAGFIQLTKAGALDNSFGDHGRVLVPLPTGAFLDDFALETNGRIVGVANHPGAEYVFRLEANGQPDLDFGTNGVLTLPLQPGETLDQVAVLPNHKIVLAGSLQNLAGTLETEVVRRTASGAFDGELSLPFGAGSSTATDVSVSPDGKNIGVAVDVFDDGSGNSGMGIWLLDGATLDPRDYGDGFGRVIVKATSGLDAGALLVSNGTGSSSPGDNGIVTLAGRQRGANPLAFVARLTHAGKLDASFGSHGRATLPVTALAGVRSLARDASGRLLVSGSTSPDGFAAARFKAGGTVDTSFGTGGSVSLAPPFPFVGVGAAVEPTGEIIIAGSFGIQGVIRLTDGGAIDQTFHAGGVVTYTRNVTPDVSTIADAAAVSSTGQLYLAGSEQNTTATSIVLMRTVGNGYRDTRFTDADEAGFGESFLASDQNARAVAVDSQGRVLVAGCTNCSNDASTFLLARFLATGRLDTGFGAVPGTITTGFDQAAAALALAVDTNNSIATAGRDGAKIAVARYDSSGQPLAAFSGDGKASVSFPGALTVDAIGVAIQSDHKVVVAGTMENAQGEIFAVARFRTDGSLDPAFGNGGRATATFSAGPAEATGMALRNDGRIVVVGNVNTSGGLKIGIARFLGTGHLDTTFGAGGKVVAALGPGDDAAGGVLADGSKTVVGGTNFTNAGAASFEVSRFASNGTLDTSFNGSGFDMAPVSGSDAEANAIVRTPGGSYIVAGEANDPNGQVVMTAVKFTP